MIPARELTRLLTAPPAAPIDDGTRGALRDRLVSGVGPLVGCLPPGEDVVVDLPLLRQARTCPELLGAPSEAFAWKSLFVRRSLGLAIVRSCVSGHFRTPMEAAMPVSDEALAAWQRTGWRTFHWEPWFAGLAPGARATVLADAVSWATPLWSAFEWGAIAQLPVVGGVDDQWSCPAPRAARLKGRSELRVPLATVQAGSGVGDRGNQPEALVSMCGGRSRAAWPEELAFLALAAALRSPSRPVPARVLGLWPDSGAHSVVETGPEVLMAAVDLVVSTVDAVVSARLGEATGAGGVTGVSEAA